MYLIVQSQAQSTALCFNRCFTVKEVNDSNMIDPDDDGDIDIELSETSLGFAKTLLTISPYEQTLRLVCFVDVVTVKVK